MRLPSWSYDENTWKSCFVHMAEAQSHFESCCRKPRASPTIGRNEKDEQAAENLNGGSAFLGFDFPNLDSLAQIFHHFKAGYCCPLASQGFQTFLEIQIQKTGKASSQL